ncbi:unnamed protein product [Ostreobium quekettii]|uniref:Uncharacterized protein n=1 Tax=Ostreobium quekettii TaxID=121088 RepID=A0A8S1JEH4_9CHLO|nr:unnamed protein product [Ostreobium quekettii]|eukprot:evm.model.scf_2779.2 EVM.evm.TU.scf_2779.2   scf_2779:15464-16371(+)
MSANRTTAGEPGDSVEQQQQPALCINNCGFFSNPGCGGMCSKCFRDLGHRQDKRDKETVQTSARDVKLIAKAGGDALMEEADPAPAMPHRPQRAEPEALPPGGQICPLPPGPATGQTSGGQQEGVEGASGAPSASGACSPPRKRRCTADACKKRVGMMGFKCRCGGVFCEAHRYPEAHACEFDHKASERQKIATENPVVRGDKLDKI